MTATTIYGVSYVDRDQDNYDRWRIRDEEGFFFQKADAQAVVNVLNLPALDQQRQRDERWMNQVKEAQLDWDVLSAAGRPCSAHRPSGAVPRTPSLSATTGYYEVCEVEVR